MSFKGDLKIIEPEFFSGDELEIVDTKPNLVRRTLKTMEIQSKHDQDLILEKIEKLVKQNESVVEAEDQNENENENENDQQDIWK